ncbi:MAG: hypothetical protein LKI77_05370 [Bifidobacterium sp.]|jgi:hypothetical protein|nr:hypothetical protein [Bifidobacterium sp.]
MIGTRRGGARNNTAVNQYSIALRRQIAPRAVIFCAWTVWYLAPVSLTHLVNGAGLLLVRMHAMSSYSPGIPYVEGLGRGSGAMMVLCGFVLSLAMFRELLSNAVARTAIACTHMLANVALVVAVALLGTALSFLSDTFPTLLSFHNSFGFEVFARSQVSVFGPIRFPDLMLGWMSGEADYVAMFCTVTLTLLLCIFAGHAAGELWAVSGAIARVTGVAAVVVLVPTAYSFRSDPGLMARYIRVIGLMRGHVTRFVPHTLLGYDLPNYQTTFSIWPQLAFTVALCAVFAAMSLFFTRRRQLAGVQRVMGIL